VHIEEVPLVMKYEDVADFISVSTETSGLLARIWATTSDEEREVIAARLTDDFAPFAVDGRYELPGVAVVASAS
jgi:hypothetical protein